MSTEIYDTLKETVNLLILEILGKFDFEQFKRISRTNERPKEPEYIWDIPTAGQEAHPEIVYAKKFLPFLGSGSSRITFALSGDKTLKIAKNNAGAAQNKAEVEVAQKLGQNELVTKVFDFSPDFKWMVAEIVKPLEPNEFEQFIGLDSDKFQRLMDWFEYNRSLEDFWRWRKAQMDKLASDIDRYRDNADRAKQLGEDEDVEIYMERIARANRQSDFLKSLNYHSPIIKFAKDLMDVAKKLELEIGDLVRLEHFGRTVKGKIRLYDYGLTKSVFDKHYKAQY